MVSIATLEGIIDGRWTYHYDVGSDVLYLRLRTDVETSTYGEETPDGLILLRRIDNDSPAGLTVVDWWKRFGNGPLPDSIDSIQQQIAPWSAKIAA